MAKVTDTQQDEGHDSFVNFVITKMVCKDPWGRLVRLAETLQVPCLLFGMFGGTAPARQRAIRYAILNHASKSKYLTATKNNPIDDNNKIKQNNKKIIQKCAPPLASFPPSWYCSA